MERVAEIRRVDEAVERPLDFPDSAPMDYYLNELIAQAEFGDELYGLKIALEHNLSSSELETYLRTQEATHIQEGLELQQRDSTEFLFNGKHVLDPDTALPMQTVARQGYEAQKAMVTCGRGHEFMVRRTAHDIEVAADNDQRMTILPPGSMWCRVTPFAEDEDPVAAAEAGFWVENRRAFIWLYRKKDDQTLETTIISVDHSSVAAFAAFLHDYGIDIPPNISSHDVVSFVIELGQVGQNETARDRIAKKLAAHYQAYVQQPTLEDLSIGSKEFIETYAQQDIHSLVRLQQEIILMIRDNYQELTPYARAATQAVLSQQFINQEERRLLMKLVNIASPRAQLPALRLLMKAHRVGVWKGIKEDIESYKTGKALTMSNTVSMYQSGLGAQISLYELHQLEKNTENTQQAAAALEVQPGCPGGAGFLSQISEAQLKRTIFNPEQAGQKKWMSCPFCKKEKATYDDPCARKLECRFCKACVENGKVVSTGKQEPKVAQELKVIEETMRSEIEGSHDEQKTNEEVVDKLQPRLPAAVEQDPILAA